MVFNNINRVGAAGAYCCEPTLHELGRTILEDLGKGVTFGNI